MEGQSRLHWMFLRFDNVRGYFELDLCEAFNSIESAPIISVSEGMLNICRDLLVIGEVFSE